jgi:hypothetical protein
VCVESLPTGVMSLLYTGAPNAMCPITLTHLHELTHPVAFASDLSQPYELIPLWEWILLSKRHPLTGETNSLCDITALELPWNDGQHTESMLDELWSKFQETQVPQVNIFKR